MVEWSLWMLMSLLLTAEFGVDKMNYFRRPNFYQWEEFTGKSLHKSKCLEVDKLELNDMKFTEAAYFKRSRESYHMELKEILVGSQFSSVQSLSRVQLFVTPCTAACPASLSITNSRSLLKLMPIKSMMPSDHLILCHPLLLLPSIFPSIRVFLNESVLLIRCPKYWSFSFSPSNWKVVAELWKTQGVLASGGEEFNPGPVTRLDHSELLCNQV